MFQVLLSYNKEATLLKNNTEVCHASAKAKVTQNTLRILRSTEVTSSRS